MQEDRRARKLLRVNAEGACHPVSDHLQLQVYLRPYKLEEYEALVKPLGLWPFPRGHQRHLTWLPSRCATVLLADQRSCPVLPNSLRIRAHPGLQPTAAQRGADCDTACRYVFDAMLKALTRDCYAL